MTTYIKKFSETVTKLRNGAGDTVLELTVGPHPTLDLRNDGKTYYSLSSRMLCINSTSPVKADVFSEARVALEELLEALKEMEDGK